MLTDDGQDGTKVWICKMLMVTTSSPFFAKPNVICCASLVVVQNKSK